MTLLVNSESGETLLVVSEAVEVAEFLQNTLSPRYQVLICGQGEESRALDRHGALPDLILLHGSSPEAGETCRRFKETRATAAIPVIFLPTGAAAVAEEEAILASGVVDICPLPISPALLLARVGNHLSLAGQQAMRKAMKNLRVTEITAGVFWLQVPEADLYLLCGCPAEVVKHMIRKGYIVKEKKNDVVCETGPNAILLSDLMVQNGDFSNLAEFPVLQMLYRQGMLLPGHPNNTGARPLLIGSERQVQSQLDYIHRGNYGLLTLEELLAEGVAEETARMMMRIKRYFAFGEIRSPESFLDARVVGETWVKVKNGVTARRVGLNRFEFAYRGQSATVDLNLTGSGRYQAPYTLDFHLAPRDYFAVLHSGEGDGWDINRPSMASVLMFQGRIYLVDAPPNVTHTLETLGIDISEVAGIFHTHCHDDHFAGLISLMRSDHPIKYFATPMVRASVARKLAALLAGEVGLEQFFHIQDLVPGQWNNCDELQVQPLYSPHPVETSILLFRVDDGHGAKTYAHWADLTAWEVLDAMTGDGPNQVPAAFIQQVKAAYLTPADLKKLDIGGGMIHGRAEDFRDDTSTIISLAHIDRKLTDGEKEIGSAAPFGAVEVLIPSTRDYLRDQADRNIRTIFPGLPPRKLESLINVPMVTVNPGAIIRRRGEQANHVDMVLTGGVEYVHASAAIRNRLASGSLIGEQALFSEAPLKGTWRAVSHVRLLRFPLALLRTFIEDNGLLEDMRTIIRKVNFLRESWLFGEKLTFTILIGLARVMHAHHLQVGEPLLLQEEPSRLCLVKSGMLHSQSGLTIGPGEMWGESGVLGRSGEDFPCRAATVSDVVLFPGAMLRGIPVVLWKLQEVAERRRLLTLYHPPHREEPFRG